MKLLKLKTLLATVPLLLLASSVIVPLFHSPQVGITEAKVMIGDSTVILKGETIHFDAHGHAALLIFEGDMVQSLYSGRALSLSERSVYLVLSCSTQPALTHIVSMLTLGGNVELRDPLFAHPPSGCALATFIVERNESGLDLGVDVLTDELDNAVSREDMLAIKWLYGSALIVTVAMLLSFVIKSLSYRGREIFRSHDPAFAPLQAMQRCRYGTAQILKLSSPLLFLIPLFM